MRGAVRNKGRWKGRRAPSQHPSSYPIICYLAQADAHHRSFLTLNIYMNALPPECGGATRFMEVRGPAPQKPDAPRAQRPALAAEAVRSWNQCVRKSLHFLSSYCARLVSFKTRAAGGHGSYFASVLFSVRKPGQLLLARGCAFRQQVTSLVDQTTRRAQRCELAWQGALRCSARGVARMCAVRKMCLYQVLTRGRARARVYDSVDGQGEEEQSIHYDERGRLAPVPGSVSHAVLPDSDGKARLTPPPTTQLTARMF